MPLLHRPWSKKRSLCYERLHSCSINSTSKNSQAGSRGNKTLLWSYISTRPFARHIIGNCLPGVCKCKLMHSPVSAMMAILHRTWLANLTLATQAGAATEWSGGWILLGVLLVEGLFAPLGLTGVAAGCRAGTRHVRSPLTWPMHGLEALSSQDLCYPCHETNR